MNVYVADRGHPRGVPLHRSTILLLNIIKGVAKAHAAAIVKTLDLSKIDQDGAAAFHRLAASGAKIEDVLRVARAVNVDAVVRIIQIFDQGFEHSLEGEPLGWATVETLD